MANVTTFMVRVVITESSRENVPHEISYAEAGQSNDRCQRQVRDMRGKLTTC
jgi:hypothetical protein